jgi:GNAT superfamily N-acetyltransferase
MTTEAPTINIRPYEASDEKDVLRLLEAAMGAGPAGARSTRFFNWKHTANPFGRSFMLVAESSDGIVGLRAFLRWEFRSGDRRIRAVRAVDTATHPAYQGRGIFSALTKAAADSLRADTDLIFNTPNEKSLPGYLKMGWQVVTHIPVYVRPARPVRALTHLLRPARSLPRQSGMSVEHAIGSVVVPFETLCPPLDERITTARSAPYLAWRYSADAQLGYRAVTVPPAGLAIYRVRRRGRLVEATVSELLAPSVGEAVSLLRRVRRASGADYLAAHHAIGTIGRIALRRQGFVRAPGGPILVSRPLRACSTDPLNFDNWSLSVGDFEVL